MIRDGERVGELECVSGAYEYSEFGGSAIVIWFSSLFRTNETRNRSFVRKY